MVGGFDSDWSADIKLVNMYVNIKEGDMGGGDGSGELDRAGTAKLLKKKEKRITAMGP